MSEYDDVVGSFLAPEDNAAETQEKDYDSAVTSVLGNTDPAKQMRANIYSSSDIKPEVAADDLKLINKYNLPLDTVRRNRDTIKKEDAFNSFDAEKIAKDYPVLAGEMSDPAKAPILKPDIEGMSYLEKVWNNTKQETAVQGQSEELGRIGISRMLGTDEDLPSDDWLLLKRSQQPQTDYELGLLGRIPGHIAGTAAQQIDMVAEPLAAAGAVYAAGAGIGAGIGAAAGGVGAIPGALAGAASARVPASIAFKTGMGIQAFTGEAGNAFNEFADIKDEAGNSVDRTSATGAAVLTGLANAGLEFIGSEAMFSKFPGMKQLFGREAIKEVLQTPTGRQALAKVGKAFVKTAAVEGGTEGIQEFVTAGFGEILKASSGKEFQSILTEQDPVKRSEMLSGLIDRVFSAAEAGAFGGGAVGAVGQTVTMGADAVNKNRQYKADQNTITQQKEAVRNVATGDIAPSVLKDFLMKQPQSDIYMDAGKVKEFFQNQEDPESYNEFIRLMPEAAEQLEEAAAIGGDLIIPNSSVAFMFNQTKETKQFDKLQEFMRLDPETRTDAELEDEIFERIIPELGMTESQAEAQISDTQARAADLEAKLTEGYSKTGQYTPANAAAYGKLMRKQYETLIDAAEGNPEVVDYINQLVGKIQTPRGEMSDKKAPKFSDDILEEIRKGPKTKTAKEKKYVLDYLQNLGGIEEDSFLAGELKNMGITKKTNKKLFKKGSTGPNLMGEEKISGALREGDNIPIAEFNAAFEDFDITAQDDGNGYVDRDWLLELVRSEAQGKGPMTRDERTAQERSDLIDAVMQAIDESGIDLSLSTNDEVTRALTEGSMDGYYPQEGQTLYQNQELKTDTPAFKEWFGASKVVDADGKPLVVYHGTKADFDKFDLGEFGKTDSGWLGRGFYFTPDTKAAELYARKNPDGSANLLNEGSIVPTYISIKNPYITDRLISLEFSNELQADGYDGIMYYPDGLDQGEGIGQVGEIVAFDPKQIKSVFNRGTFDKNDPRILYQSAFHGSPHRFDKFTLEHIGTGEGAQAYGWGLYFAGKKEVAEFYREALTKQRRGNDLNSRTGKILIGDKPVQTRFDIENDDNLVDLALASDKDGALAYANKKADRWAELEKDEEYPFRSYASEKQKAWSGLRDALEKGETFNSAEKGQLYEVKIPEDDVLLHWDKPLSEQPEAVKKALSGESVGDFKVSETDQLLADLTDVDLKDSGAALYKSMVKRFGSDVEASKHLNELGVKGIKYLDGSSRVTGEGSHNYVIFDDSAIETLRTFYQDQGSGPRGSAVFSNQGTFINIFKGANASTPLHEGAHVWLDTVRQVYSHPQAPERMKHDLNTLHDWWAKNADDLYRDIVKKSPFAVTEISKDIYEVRGISGALGRFKTREEAKTVADKAHQEVIKEINDNGGVEYVRNFAASRGTSQGNADDAVLIAMDEYFARGFEAYLLKGEAPSIDVIPLFEKFRSWLVGIYQSVKNLGVKLDPEITGFFDRLIATDSEIAALKSNPLFRADPQVMKMLTKTEQADYIKRGEKAEREARNSLLRKANRQWERQYSQWWKEELAKVTDEVSAQVSQEQVYKAIDMARNDKMDRKQVVALVGESVANALPKSTVVRTKGVAPAVVADLSGYKNANVMINEIVRAEPIKERVERLARDEMIKRHGDMMEDGTISQAALNAAMNAAKGDQTAYELRAIYRQFGAEAPSRQAFIARAEQILSNTRIDKTRPGIYYNAAIRASREAGKALAQKRYEDEVKTIKGKRVVTPGAAQWKAKQLLNQELYRLSLAKRREIEKALDKFKKYQKAPPVGKPVKMDEEYRQKIVKMLAPFSFGPRLSEAKRTRLEMKAIVDWMNNKQNETILVEGKLVENPDFDGAVFDIPEELTAAAAKSNFQEMTIGEFMGLRDTVENIATQGTKKRQFMLNGKVRDFQELRDEFIESIGKNAIGEAPVVPIGSISGIVSGFRNFVASNIKARTLARQLDGFEEDGLAQQILMQGVDVAMDRKTTRQAQAGERFHDLLLKNYTKKELKGMSGLLPDVTLNGTINVPTVGPMTREARIMAAMNWGNDGNRQALMLGNGWNEEQVEAILATLEEKDLTFIQETWDWIDEYWPEIEALEKRSFGIAPEKVKADPFEVKIGDKTIKMKGGYFPIKADSNKYQKSGADQINEEMKGIFAASSAQTSKGHTMERTGAGNTKRPLSLDFGVITSHVSNVIHDLELREPLQNSYRMLRSSSVKEAITNRLGIEKYKQIDLFLRDVAQGERGPSDWWSGLNAAVRANASIAYMGFKISTLVSQPSGLVQAAATMGTGREGWKWIRTGAKRLIQNYTGNPSGMSIEWIHNESEFMKNRHLTFNRDLKQAQEYWKRDPKSSQNFRQAAMWHILQIQKIIDAITWSGAYEQALSGKVKGIPEAKEEQAIRYADRIVRGQASGLMQDLSGIERGTLNERVRQNALLKLGTMMLSYFNAKLNVVYEKTAQTDFGRKSDILKYGIDMASLVWLDALITGILLDNLPDDEDDDSWLWWVMKQPASLFPFIRDISGSLDGFDNTTPLESLFNRAGDLATQAKQGEVDMAMTKAGLDVVGLTFGLPSGEAKHLINLMDRMSSGKEIEYKDLVRSRAPGE